MRNNIRSPARRYSLPCHFWNGAWRYSKIQNSKFWASRPKLRPTVPEENGTSVVGASRVCALRGGTIEHGSGNGVWDRRRCRDRSRTLDSGLAGVAVDIFLAWPKTYDMDTVLIPAVVKLSGPARAVTTAFARLRAACVAHLRARIAVPLAPPTDWPEQAQ